MEATMENQTKPDPAEAEALALEAQAKTFVITSDEDFTRADELLVLIANRKKQIAEDWDSVISKAHETHKDAIGKKKTLLAPCLAAEAIIRPRMAEYHTAKKIEAEKVAAAAAVTSKAAMEEDRIYIAHELEKSGRAQEAEAVLSQPIVAPPPMASWSPVPASRGTSFKETWKARVSSFPELVKAVAEGRAPAHLLLPNDSALNGLAKALKASAQIPGVEFYKEIGTSVRATK